ncbi:hypothetical protein P7228_09090 [Altererythrobacter arenosus]|uniref:Uncharacterized protein n=1 Tax=Altererythrobacter arenosus TaxID=3032592 RepID=A0ABY8FRX1_9SPHN|nr:hypothetical protein [Altererythrobacter sp. CAU 1644]WFL76156.1 hypothetical protein P7228_09090 [Altererythrobacter sp. CAU 1644]
MLLFANSKEGVATRFLERQLGIGYFAAFTMAARIRMHMAALENDRVVGRKGERLFVKLVEFPTKPCASQRQVKSCWAVLLSDVSQIVSVVVENLDQHSILKAINQRGHAGAMQVTTCRRTLDVLCDIGARSALAWFEHDNSARHPSIPDRAPGFVAHVKLHLKGQFGRVTTGRLWTYLKEFEFRHNRIGNPSSVYWDLIGRFPDLGKADVDRIEAKSFIQSAK